MDKPWINWGKFDDSACVNMFVPTVPKFELHCLVVKICSFSSPASMPAFGVPVTNELLG